MNHDEQIASRKLQLIAEIIRLDDEAVLEELEVIIAEIKVDSQKEKDLSK